MASLPHPDQFDGKEPDQTSQISARDRLLHQIDENTDLPALGSSVSRVVQIASSDDQAVRELAYFILSDVALTQKILRLANTVSYHRAAGTPVTTISKAIFLLGFDTVKTSALAMLLVDSMAGKHAQSVRNELNHALCASIVGRETALHSPFQSAEEAAIAALFKNIGRLLVAAYDHVLYDEIFKLVEAGKHTAAQASVVLLGCSFDFLAEAVLREWKIPEAIVHALVPPPSGKLRPARHRQEWLQQVAAFSAATARLMPAMQDPEYEKSARKLLDRFGVALEINRERFDKLLENVVDETRILAENAGPLPPSGEESSHTESSASADGTEGMNNVLAELLLDPEEDPFPLEITARHPSGKPVNARDLLLAGMQDVTQMVASGHCKLNDLMLLVLETLCNSLGCRFAVACLRDVQSGQFRARIGIGEKHDERQEKFHFAVSSGRDLFSLALENNADLMISDASAPKIRSLVPPWHQKLLPDARSFIVLPLVLQNKQIGLFYADRTQPAPEGVPADETALIRTLKGQVLTAFSAR